MSFGIKLPHLGISMRLMLANAAILVSMLLLTSLLTILGIYYSLYHQAEVEMGESIHATLLSMERSEKLDPDALPPIPTLRQQRARRELDPDWVMPPQFALQLYRDGALTRGVVLRVADGDGALVFDSDSHAPSLNEVQKHIVKSPPFLSSQAMHVVFLNNFQMYYQAVSAQWKGKPYQLHFLRMITAEREFLHLLRNGLLLTNTVGILLALIACYYVSRKALRPLRTITQTAQEIEVTDLSRRIPLPSADDEMRELAATINRMLERIESGFDQQRRFVSDASHELRTPVTVILGYADMLRRWGSEDEEVLEEGITAIGSEANNMKSLIERLLFLVRADLNRQALNRKLIDMAVLLADVARTGQMIAPHHTVTLKENEPSHIFGDVVMIRQMLRIFLDNAVKYTPEGGEIFFMSQREGGRLHVIVADTGIGIAPEHQPKVFDRFYRVDSSRAKEGGGIGLGLAIARWIADAHDIRIALTSEVGKGTTIHLYIPLVNGGCVPDDSKTAP
ncbi:MAG: sensor histidine kinase [Schwartzia sp. (in: firmicutes)]